MRQREKSMRGRPSLDLSLQQVMEAVRQHRQVMGAARVLGCSPSYIHKRLKLAGLTLVEVLES